MSLAQALSSAVSGLRTTQASLAIVAANVANAETPGYVRKTLTQATTAAGAFGVSVRPAGINRVLDQYVQRQLRVEISGGIYADTRAQFYQSLQQIYGEPGSASALDAVFNNFTNALQALSTSPESASTRSAVFSAAQILTQQLNGMTDAIQSLRSDAEQGLAEAVRNANAAMSQIATINQKLATSTSNDAATATLMDQRDAYIDQLSQLMDIKVIAGDFNQVTIFTNSGIQLVGTQASQLQFDAQGTVTPSALWDPDPDRRTVGTITLTSPNGGDVDLIANKSIRSGQIAAYLEMRDDALVAAQAQLDEIAAAMSRALSDKTIPASAVSTGAQAGFEVDVGGLLAGNTIQLNYTDIAANKTYNYTIIRVDDPAALPLADTATPDPNDRVIGVDFTGGMASVVSQLNAAFNGKLQFSNPSGTTLRVLDDGVANNTNVNALSAIQTVTSLTGGSVEFPFFTDAFKPYSGAITSLGSQSLGLAGRIVVNPSLVADPAKLVAFASGIAAGDPARPNFLYDQLTGGSFSYSPQAGIGTTASPFSGSLGAYMRQMISLQGQAASDATSLAQGQDVVVNALRQRLADGSEVNIDEEMSNLLNLQTAYGANARVMSTVRDMIDALLNI